MKGEMTIGNTIKKRWLYIIIIGLLVAVGLSVMKYFFTAASNRHGDYLFVRTVQVQSTGAPLRDDFDYKGFLESPANYYQFIHSAENGGFDFVKVDSAWTRKSQYEQMDSLKRSVQVFSYRDNVLQFVVHFEANVTPDVDYMKTHGEILIDDFVNQSEQSIKAVRPDATFKVVSKESSVPVVDMVDRKKVAIKFAVIGFIIGVLGAVIFFALWAIRGQQK